MKTKFLVLGSGAAAVGVLYGLIDKYGESIVVDIITSERFEDSFVGNSSSQGFLIPQKRKYGVQPSQWKSSENSLKVYDSRSHSMTQFWGAGMMPAKAGEEPDCIDSQDYGLASDSLLGKLQILGEEDYIAGYLGRTSYNKEWPNQSNFPRFDTESNGVRFCSGRGRISLPSRKDRNCTLCGMCMSGCPEDVIWHSRMEIEKIAQIIDLNILSGEVQQVKESRLVISSRNNLESVWLRDYKRTFLATGVVSTSKIVLRSLDEVESLEFCDTPVYTIPFILKDNKYKQKISLANDMIFIDGANGTQLASVYPFFSEIWETKVFGLIGKLGLARLFLENHVGFIRLYSNKTNALRIVATLDSDGMLNLSKFDWGICAHDKTLIKDLKKLLLEYSVISFPVKLSSLNSAHYYGGAYSSISGANLGELFHDKFPSVRLADAFTIADMPSISPTYTIIVNAYLQAQRD